MKQHVLVAAAILALSAVEPARAAPPVETDLVVPTAGLHTRALWAGGFSGHHVSYFGAGVGYPWVLGDGWNVELGARAGVGTFRLARTGTLQLDGSLGLRKRVALGPIAFAASLRANGGYATVTHADDGVNGEDSTRVEWEAGADTGVRAGPAYLRLFFGVARPLSVPTGAPEGRSTRMGLELSLRLPDARQTLVVGLWRVQDWYPDRSGNPASLDQVFVGFTY